MSDTTSKDDELDYDTEMAIMRAVVGDHPISYSESGKKKASELRTAIKQYGIQERIDEIAEIPVEHGRWKTLTYVTGKGQTIEERHAELTTLKGKETE